MDFFYFFLNQYQNIGIDDQLTKLKIRVSPWFFGEFSGLQYEDNFAWPNNYMTTVFEVQRTDLPKKLNEKKYLFCPSRGLELFFFLCKKSDPFLRQFFTKTTELQNVKIILKSARMLKMQMNTVQYGGFSLRIIMKLFEYSHFAFNKIVSMVCYEI